MPIQTTYPSTIAVGYAGEIADSAHHDVLSRICEDATLAFGRAVIQGTAQDQVKVGAAGVFMGLTVRDPTLPADNTDLYKAGNSVGVMIKGAIFVLAGEAVVAGDSVYRTATGTLNKTAAGNTLIANALWETTTANGAIARIRLR